jgi:hypothetical protein
VAIAWLAAMALAGAGVARRRRPTPQVATYREIAGTGLEGLGAPLADAMCQRVAVGPFCQRQRSRRTVCGEHERGSIESVTDGVALDNSTPVNTR